MRCVYCTLAISLLVGCQNQTVPVSNPFMPPDRVPPPSTRIIPPGTAQPYYSGGPAPTLQPGAVVPPTYVPGNVIPPTTPVTPAAQPGIWNPKPPGYPPQPGSVTPSTYNVTPVSAEIPSNRIATANEPPVQIQADDQSLRLNTIGVQTLANVEPTAQLPLVVPAQFEDLRNSSQPEEQPAYPVVNTVPREVTIRAVASPEAENVANSSGFRSPSQDGFRPQGSHRRDDASRTSSDTVDRFGFDPQYRWLRGQLEYEPTSQQWQLRYISQVGHADQYGGRLLIANPMLLGDLQPGDHVQVHGQLDGQQTGPNTMVPVYSISAIQRQR